MWTGYPTFHHVAAPFLVFRPHKLPALESFVLRALSLCKSRGNSNALGEWLHLDAGLITQVLKHLERGGLVTFQDGGLAEVTGVGRHALEHGDYARPCKERRTLYFWHADWAAPASSCFVPLHHVDAITWLAAPPTPFAVEQLAACVGQSAEWKKRHAFPEEIGELLAKPAGVSVDTLDQVVLAAPQRCFAVVVQTNEGGAKKLSAFAANSRSWELHAAQPAFTMPDDPPGWFPPPLTEPAVRQAFAEWCHQRQISSAETEQCVLKPEGSRLLVTAPAAWQERLHPGRGESWVLAGEGAVKTALRLELRDG
jgi:hypothetical protein